MTDEQIIKALECCMKGNNCGGCCPYDDEDETCEECTSKLAKEALDLIKRQQAEIEKQKESLKYYLDNNEESGVVYIPKFVVEKRLKELTEGSNA